MPVAHAAKLFPDDPELASRTSTRPITKMSMDNQIPAQPTRRAPYAAGTPPKEPLPWHYSSYVAYLGICLLIVVTYFGWACGGLNTRIGWPSSYWHHGRFAFLGYVVVVVTFGTAVVRMVVTRAKRND